MRTRMIQRPLLMPALAALLLALQVGLRNARVFTISFDGWTYWEGATSLSRGQGYVDLLGQPITAWPPLFSQVLALFAAPDGLSLGQIKLAVLLLAALSGGCWSLLMRREFGGTSRAIRLLAQAYPLLLFPASFDSLLSEPLWIPLVGLLLLQCLSYRPSPWRFAGVALLMLASLMTRHQSLALLPAILVFPAIRSGARQALQLALPLLTAVCGWGLHRLLSPQLHSHTIGFGSGGYVAALQESLGSLVEGFTYSAAGLAVPAFVFCLLAALALLCATVRCGAAAAVGSRPWRGCLSWLLFALLFWFGSVALAYLAAVPVDQPRFYVLALLGALCGFLWAICLIGGRRLRRLALVLLALLTSAMLYRSLYFIGYRLAHPQAGPAADLVLSRAWIDSKLSAIDQSVNSGVPLSQACARQGISVGRYRIWKGLPLLPPSPGSP